MYAGIFTTERFPRNCDRADQKSGSPIPETNLDTLYAFLGGKNIFRRLWWEEAVPKLCAVADHCGCSHGTLAL